jgi:molecular chaperone GrpE
MDPTDSAPPPSSDTEPVVETPSLSPVESAELRLRAARADELTDRLQRTLAEYGNYQKRAAKDREQARLFGMRDLLRALLPSIDNLDRALQSADAQGGSLLEGVRMTSSEIQRVLAEVGIKALHPRGEKLDPRVHEAIAKVAAGDAAPGTILDVAERGYVLGEIVIRPARVVVAGEPPAESKAQEN